MRKAILAAMLMLILGVLALSGCQTTIEPETEEAVTEEAEAIPTMSIDDCLKEIKEANPDMTDQAANDNCWIIQAVNQQDQALCDKVSESFKSVCLAQFE